MAVRLGTVITALHAAADAAMPDVKVVDGPVVSSTKARAWLFVGANDTPGEPGVSVVDGTEGVLPQFVIAPTISVDCTIQCWNGTVNIPARRAEAEAIADQLEQLLVPNPTGVTLGLTEIESARIGSIDYAPLQATTGASVTLTVTVEVQMRTATR